MVMRTSSFLERPPTAEQPALRAFLLSLLLKRSSTGSGSLRALLNSWLRESLDDASRLKAVEKVMGSHESLSEGLKASISSVAIKSSATARISSAIRLTAQLQLSNRASKCDAGDAMLLRPTVASQREHSDAHEHSPMDAECPTGGTPAPTSSGSDELSSSSSERTLTTAGVVGSATSECSSETSSSTMEPPQACGAATGLRNLAPDDIEADCGTAKHMHQQEQQIGKEEEGRPQQWWRQHVNQEEQGKQISLKLSPSRTSLTSLGKLVASAQLQPRVSLQSCGECRSQIDGPVFMLNDRAYCCQRHRLAAYHKQERESQQGSLVEASTGSVDLEYSGLRASFRAWI